MGDGVDDKAIRNAMPLLKAAIDKSTEGLLDSVAEILRGILRQHSIEMRSTLQDMVVQALSVGVDRQSAPVLSAKRQPTIGHGLRTRPVQDIITECLAQSAGPTHRSEVQAAVVAEGYTTSAFKKRIKIMQDQGIVRRSGSSFALSTPAETVDVGRGGDEEDAS